MLAKQVCLYIQGVILNVGNHELKGSKLKNSLEEAYASAEEKHTPKILFKATP